MTSASPHLDEVDPEIFQQDLRALINYPEEGIATHVLVKSPIFNYTLICVPQGRHITFHNLTGDTAITVLEGKGMLQLAESALRMEEGMFLFIPAHITQGATANENLAFLHCLTH